MKTPLRAPRQFLKGLYFGFLAISSGSAQVAGVYET
jgi:hypothetical protein